MRTGAVVRASVVAAWVCALCAGQTVPQVVRQGGTDGESGIAWVLLSVEGKQVSGATGDAPRLTAQCTKRPTGKLRFELLADFGGGGEVRFVPPWVQKSPMDFPPRLEHVQITMDFLGYMKVKPVKRQWVGIDGLAGEWKYATPGMDSGNMEEIMFYLQYLRALPTLRLTLPGRGAAQWETAALQQAIHAEPLCGASGL